jgi:hypothetical protein
MSNRDPKDHHAETASIPQTSKRWKFRCPKRFNFHPLCHPLAYIVVQAERLAAGAQKKAKTTDDLRIWEESFEMARSMYPHMIRQHLTKHPEDATVVHELLKLYRAIP